MKTQSSLLIYILLLAFLGCDGCKKDDPIPVTQEPSTLPPITTEGNNTFGCYVDGKLWLPFNILYPKMQGAYGSGYFNTSAVRRPIDEPSSSISIIINKEVFDTGEYKLSFIMNGNDSLGRVKYYYALLPDYDSNLYYVDTVHTGSLHLLRLDSINHIISGTFYFDAYNKYLNKTVKITEGRFDLRYAN